MILSKIPDRISEMRYFANNDLRKEHPSKWQSRIEIMSKKTKRIVPNWNRLGNTTNVLLYYERTILYTLSLVKVIMSVYLSKSYVRQYSVFVRRVSWFTGLYENLIWAYILCLYIFYRIPNSWHFNGSRIVPVHIKIFNN